MIIPVTFLKITQAFREIEAGETIEIVGSDTDTRKDLFKIQQISAYELVAIEDEATFYRICLKKDLL
jgi:TusA-related sulfurtransferase